MPDTPYGYQPGLWEKLKISTAKNLPFLIGRVIQTAMYGIFLIWRFIIQLFRDAIGR